MSTLKARRETSDGHEQQRFPLNLCEGGNGAQRFSLIKRLRRYSIKGSGFGCIVNLNLDSDSVNPA